MPGQFAKLFDPVFLTRPTLMYPVWTFFLAGYWSADRLSETSRAGITGAVLIGIGVTMIMAAVYILNQTQDIETDRINRKLFLICDGHVTLSSAYLEAALLTFTGLFFAFMADARAGLLLFLLFVLAAWLYSYPPASWKDKPVASVLVNGAGGMLIASLGWVAAGGEGLIPLRTIVHFGGYAAVAFNTMLPDIEGDRAAGKITFAVRYGLRKTVLWALITMSLTTGFAAVFQEWILFWPGLIMIPFYVYALSRKDIGDVIRATKYSVFAVAVSVCVVFPWFILPVLVVFLMSKWYYKARFGLDYPNLKGG